MRKVQTVYDYRARERQTQTFLAAYRGRRSDSEATAAAQGYDSGDDWHDAPASPAEEDFDASPAHADERRGDGGAPEGGIDEFFSPTPPRDVFGGLLALPPPPPQLQPSQPSTISTLLAQSAERRAQKKRLQQESKSERGRQHSADGGQLAEVAKHKQRRTGMPGRPSNGTVVRCISREHLEKVLDGGGVQLRHAYEYAYGVATTSGNLEWLRGKLAAALQED